jgi:hypothetical protein
MGCGIAEWNHDPAHPLMVKRYLRRSSSHNEMILQILIRMMVSTGAPKIHMNSRHYLCFPYMLHQTAAATFKTRRAFRRVYHSAGLSSAGASRLVGPFTQPCRLRPWLTSWTSPVSRASPASRSSLRALSPADPVARRIGPSRMWGWSASDRFRCQARCREYTTACYPSMHSQSSGAISSSCAVSRSRIRSHAHARLRVENRHRLVN